MVWYPWDNILITQTQFFTYSGWVSAGLIIHFSSYNAVPISSSSIKKRNLVREAFIHIFSMI